MRSSHRPFAAYVSGSRPFTDEEKYFLPADEQEKQRLNFQHTLVRRAIRYAGDPWPFFIPKSYQFTLQPGDRILDSATGTTAWLQDAVAAVADMKGQVYVDGIDISPVQFPKPDTLPPNVELSLQNATSLPSAWSNRYTLVHQRLLIAALSRSAWKDNIDEIHRVLKPGGWATWVEFGIPYGGLATQKVHQAIVLLYQIIDYIRDPGPTLHDWLLEHKGFDSSTVEMKTYKWRFGKKAMAVEGMEGYVKDIVFSISETFASLGRGVMKGGGIGVSEIAKSEEEWARLIEEMVEEWEEIEEGYVEFRVVCAKKSEN